MINLRYHVYSLVAVFLALAIGVAAGSTVVQRSVVDNLRSTQGRIEQNLDELEAQNAELQERTAALEGREGSLLDEGPSALLSGKLAGQPLVIVRAEGIPGDAVDRVRAVLQVAGADVVADVELQAAVNDPEVLVAVGSELGNDGDGADPEQVQAVIGQQLGEAIVAVHDEDVDPERPSGDVLTDTAPTTEAPAADSAVELEDLLHQLDDLGVLSFRGSLGDDGVTTDGVELVVLGGLTTEMDPVPALDALLSAVAGNAPPMAVAADAALDEPPQEGEEPIGIVPAVRGDGRLRDQVTTVDHVADFAGLSALVLGLADLELGQVGHFGVDDGADSVLPPRRS
jgi:Copper transport outer membrane protein, MctB